MSLSPHICDEIIADIIRRHQRQILQLQSMADNNDPDWEERFRDLLRLETDLVDIRQGLQAAAYIALSVKDQVPRTNSTHDGISQRAISKTARQRFRMSSHGF